MTDESIFPSNFYHFLKNVLFQNETLFSLITINFVPEHTMKPTPKYIIKLAPEHMMKPTPEHFIHAIL